MTYVSDILHATYNIIEVRYALHTAVLVVKKIYIHSYSWVSGVYSSSVAIIILYVQM